MSGVLYQSLQGAQPIHLFAVAGAGGGMDPPLRLFGTISYGSSILLRMARSRKQTAKGSIMSARQTQDQRGIAGEVFVQQAPTNADVSVNTLQGATIRSIKSKPDCILESTANELGEAADTSLLPGIGVDLANLIRVLRQLEITAKRQAPRIAFKAKGSILLLDLADVVAVQAEGNYVSLQHRANPYLVHESLSSMAEKLRPYGFVRIHRSVVVNISAVEEIQPLPTGEYGLRVKGGKEYLVTRTYKHHLRDLAQLWVGSDRLCG
jgi:LytTr DNA-binding domain